MRDVLTLAGKLLILMLIAGLCLGATDMVTRDAIAAQEAAQAERLRREVLPEAVEFALVEGAAVSPVTEVYDAGEAGYVFEVMAKGFGGDMPITVGINKEGVLQGVRIGSHGETPGLGAKATEESFYGQYAGKPAQSLSVIKNGTAGETEISAITAATITSSAVTTAVNAAIEAYGQLQ